MADIATELVAVERKLWEGKATSVTAETTEGEIGVLPGHQPFLGQLTENGTVTIRTDDGQVMVAAVQGGFLSVSTKKITVLADKAVWADEVDVSDAEARLQSDDPEVKAKAESELRASRRAKGVASAGSGRTTEFHPRHGRGRRNHMKVWFRRPLLLAFRRLCPETSSRTSFTVFPDLPVAGPSTSILSIPGLHETRSLWTL